MTRFEELCASYATARKNFFGYREACWGIASTLVKGMIEYFQCPEDVVTLVPLNEEVTPGRYTIPGAMHFADDSFWHLGVKFRIYQAPNTHPQEEFLIDFHIKKLNDFFLVKMGPDSAEFKVHADRKEEFEEIYAWLYKRLKEYHAEGYQRMIEGEAAQIKIGF